MKQRALRRAVEETVSDLVERIAAIRLDTMHDGQGAREYEEALSYLLGCDFHFVNELAEEMEGGSRFYLNDKDMPEVSWPIDIASVTYPDAGELQFTRMWTAEPASMRGRVKFLPAKIAWLASAQLFDDGRWYAQMSPLGLINGQWRALDAGMVRVARHGGSGTLQRTVRQDPRLPRRSCGSRPHHAVDSADRAL